MIRSFNKIIQMNLNNEIKYYRDVSKYNIAYLTRGYVSSFLFKPKGSRVLYHSIRYASLVLHALSRLDRISSRGISCMSVARWMFLRKCSDTVVGVERLVCWLTGV